MKLKRLHILPRQTFGLLLFLVLVGVSLTLANFLPQTLAVDETAKPSATPDDSGASTPSKPGAVSEMPDISGMWTYNPTPPAPDDVNQDLIAPPQDFRVRRSTQAGVDFEYLGTSEPTAAPRKLRWESGTPRFRAVSDNTTVERREIFELSPDGNQLAVGILMTADDAKRLAAKGGVSDKVFTERYLTEQWRRAGAFDLLNNQSALNTPPVESKVPAAIQELMPSIVTVTKVEPVDAALLELAGLKAASRIGVVVDSRGYIAIPIVPGPAKHFVVRFANQQETMGELVAIDDSINMAIDGSLKLGILKIENPLPCKAVSLSASRESRPDERVLLVPFSASQELRSGRILSNEIHLGEGSTRLIQADIACSSSDFGSLLVSEAGEPIGLVLSSSRTRSRVGENSLSSALPVKAIQPVLQAAIDKPKDVPIVRVPRSQPVSHTVKPVQELVVDFTMPDITGRWTISQDDCEDSEVVLRRVPADSPDYEYVGKTETIRVKWLEMAQQFEGTVTTNGSGRISKISIRLTSDPSMLRVAISLNAKTVVHQTWTRPSDWQPTVTAQRREQLSNIRALPETLAAKQLVERLAAQESAAASAANEIRRLQANGDAVETIAPHQAQLKAHLQTAFELKMQLEELQVTELQSRLSRLERQIGQRKVLREKIIARRAAELISGDSLSWNTTLTDKSRAVAVKEANATDSMPPIDSGPSYNPAPGIEAIAIGLDISAAAIKNMSVTTDYKKRHVFGLPFNAPIELTLVTKTIIDNEGRLRVETTGQQINIEPDGKSARAYNGRWETVFRDGESRSLTWYEANPPTASIDSFPSLHGIHPREFTTHFQSKSVSEIIRNNAAEIAERTVLNDRQVTIVQTAPIKNANDARRYRFWFDPERNVVVRRSIEIRYAEGQPWQEYAYIENHDYQEIVPGIWLPRKVKYESLEVTPELTPAKLSWSYEGTNREWIVNSELPASTFELAFPEDAVVNDQRAILSADQWLDKLQGTWFVVQYYRQGGSQKRELYSASVRGKRMELLGPNGATFFDLVPGEPGPPQQIDLKLVHSDFARQSLQDQFESIHGYGPSRGELLEPTVRAIMEFNRDSFRICNDIAPNSPRPIEFSDSAGRVNWTFSRSGVDKTSGPGIEALAAAADRASLQETDMDTFQGTWCFDVLQSDAWPKPIGVPTDSSGRKSEQRWMISGDRITWTSLDGQQIEVSFTIDPTKTPKQIDFTFLSGPQKGMKSVGIYEPQKGNANYLWLCMTNPGTDAPRPTEVGYASEKQQSMIGIYPVARSEKPEVAESLKRFQGDWQMTLCDSTLDGLGSSQDEVKKWTWTIRGDAILWSRNGEAWELKIDVDNAKSPGELDLTYLTGPHKGAKCLGMYQWGGVDQSQLMIAIQDPGSDAPRPVQFSMNSDIKTGLMILERRSSNR